MTKKGNGVGTRPERYEERKDETEILKIGTTTTSKFFGSSNRQDRRANARRGIKEKGRVYLLRSGKTEGNLQRNKCEIKKTDEKNGQYKCILKMIMSKVDKG